jgi:hypothetical protein
MKALYMTVRLRVLPLIYKLYSLGHVFERPGEGKRSMANRAKPNEEARKDAEAFFRGDSLRTEVFLSRQGRHTPSLARK